jgi:hypothetical protein
MKTQIESWVTWILIRFQILSANLNPEVLQWPGGSFIALLLWLYIVTRPFWSVGTGGSAALRG